MKKTDATTKIKLKTKTESGSQTKPVVLKIREEVYYIANSWLSKEKLPPVSQSYIKRRITFLTKQKSKYQTRLYKFEIEWLYEYWVTQYFNEGKCDFINQRLKYCETLIGKRKSKILFTLFTNDLHKENVEETNQSTEVPFPTGWCDSDFADNN